MLTLIKSVLKSIELYLSLKNKLFYIELRHNHEKTRKRIIQEIEDLRESFGKPYIFSEVLFEESPTKGKYVNKNLDGFRVSFANSFCDKAVFTQSKKIRIL